MHFLHLVVEQDHGLLSATSDGEYYPFPGRHRNEYGALVNNKSRKKRTGVGKWFYAITLRNFVVPTLSVW